MCAHTYIHTYTYTYIHRYIEACLYTHTHIHTYIHTYRYLSTTHAKACLYTHTHTYTYIHTYIQVSFHDTRQGMLVYTLLSSMCRKAEETRERERFKPFDAPFMTNLLESCSTVCMCVYFMYVCMYCVYVCLKKLANGNVSSRLTPRS